MKRCIVALTLCLLTLGVVSSALSDDGKFKLASGTGHLLRGTLYKQSGITRTGVITIRTASGILRAAPVYRYDFDILYGSIDGAIHSFLMADIAEIDVLPPEEKDWPVNIVLRNGVVYKILMSSEGKPLIGSPNLTIKEVDVVTEKYGENTVSGGDIAKIVFQAAKPEQDEDMPGLVDEFEDALTVGKRDGLVDEDFYTVLENMQKRMKAKLTHGEK